MTFNVRGAYHRDAENVWRRRAGLCADVILNRAPDLVGFQEFQSGNRRFFGRNLPGYEMRLGPRYDNLPPHSSNAIFWNPERLEAVGCGGFWLSKTPGRFSRSWGTDQVRSANWVRFRLVPEGSEFVHLNTHLDQRSLEARLNQARVIVGFLTGMANLPAVVTGDFNAEPEKAVHRVFAEAGFGDAHLLAGNLPQKTFHRFRGERFKDSSRDWRMDWILVRGGSEGSFGVRFCEVVRESASPVYPSDHYPVCVGLSV